MKVAPTPIRWWLKMVGHSAITLPPWGMYCTPECVMDEGLARHEQVHWDQYERMGFVKFYVLYLWYAIRYGYANHPMEAEARKAQGV